MGPRGVVGGVVPGFSSGWGTLIFGSCGGKGLDETLLGDSECGAGVADRDGDELHFTPDGFEGGDEGSVLGGLLLKPLLTSEVPTEADLDDDECALFQVEGGRVRGWGVRDSSGVDEVGGGSMAHFVKINLGLHRQYPGRDAGGGLRAFHVAGCVGPCVSWVL